MLNISASVGLKGINKENDVKLIQVLLNSFLGKKKLDDDGIAGKNTIREIVAFQREIMPGWKPDGRVDPKGRTFATLRAHFSVAEQNRLSRSIQARRDYCMLKAEKLINLSNFTVSYKHTIPSTKRIVNVNSIKIIQLALARAGLDKAVITSTIRTPNQQAEIMYRNAKKNFADQKTLYGSNGDKVLDVFKANSSKSKDEVVRLMVEEIERLGDLGKRVSRHCVTKANYRKCNIIDIGLNSTLSVNKNKKSVYELGRIFKELAKEGLINRYIDETKKSNRCWHIEIDAGSKIHASNLVN